MRSASFKTRARTVDHLGREQIADCPTAISELWKNAYDAYARNVSLEVFKANPSVAVMSDDGHGMNLEDILDRWLVIGTESKTSNTPLPFEDRNGLPVRVKQGKKGIGRLSCANLGPLVLVISKKVKSPFVACLLDWRMFQNPYLNLSDIEIPVIEEDRIDDVFEKLSELKDGLLSCIRGSSNNSESDNKRIREAWLRHDKDQDLVGEIRSADIERSVREAHFDLEYLADWKPGQVLDGHGTVLMVSDINYDLRALLEAPPYNPAIARTNETFRETLHSFVDPYISENSEINDEFNYGVRVWRDLLPSLVLGSEKAFSLKQVEDMEHCIEGEIDEEGVFRGNVKVFGQWLSKKSEIKPPVNLPIPKRKDTRVGPFKLYISALEFNF